MRSSSSKRSVVGDGDSVTHQCLRSSGSKASHPEVLPTLSRHPHKTSDRQHNDGVLYKSPRRNKISDNVGRGERAVDVVSREAYINIGRTSARRKELSSRLPIEIKVGHSGVDARSSNISTTRKKITSKNRCGHVRFQDECTDAKIRVVETRQGCMEDRRLLDRLERHSSLHVPTVCNDRESVTKVYSRRSTSGTTGSTRMEHTALVPSSIKIVGKRSHPVAKVNSSSKSSSQRQDPSAERNDGVSRLDHIKRQLDDKGISEQSARLIMASWRKGTEKQYSSAWKRWDSWCTTRKINSVSTTITNICDYLTSLYDEGLAFSTINSHRSAISMTHIPIDGIRIGSHVLIQRLLKGMFNLRPPMPRYAFIWPIGKVMRYFKSLQQNDALSLKTLSMKAVLLMALVSADRGATLTSLSLKFYINSKNELRFLISSLTKTSRPQNCAVREIVITHYANDKRICPVAAIKTYIKRTANLRGNEEQLFISFVKPHKAVGKTSIARWITSVLGLAGIDTSLFKAHSTRSAATSHASAKGVPTHDILRAGDWSSATTFQRYYKRDVLHHKFQKAILDA